MPPACVHSLNSSPACSLACLPHLVKQMGLNISSITENIINFEILKLCIFQIKMCYHIYPKYVLLHIDLFPFLSNLFWSIAIGQVLMYRQTIPSSYLRVSTGHLTKLRRRRYFLIQQIGGSSINLIVSTELQKRLTAHHHANLPAYGNVSVSCQISVNFKKQVQMKLTPQALNVQHKIYGLIFQIGQGGFLEYM